MSKNFPIILLFAALLSLPACGGKVISKTDDPRAMCIDPIAVLLAAFNAKSDASATTTINGTKPPDKPNPEKK